MPFKTSRPAKQDEGVGKSNLPKVKELAEDPTTF
jgi:hypothetical protein